MVKTNGWRPTTVYRLAYRKPSLSATTGGGGGGGNRNDGCGHSQPSSASSSEAAARFDRMLADRNVIENAVPADVAIPLRSDATLSTYGRDYLLPSRVAAVAKWSTRPRQQPTCGGGGGPEAAARDCEREPATAAPSTSVAYSGPVPPEPYVAPRTEYWWTHGHLAGRMIADGAMPKRTKGCRRTIPTCIS